MTLVESLIAHPAPIHQDSDGVARVGGTRVRLASVVTAFKNGSTAEDIVLKYPSLDLTDVYAVITYYLWHRDEVDAYLEAGEHRAVEIENENQARFPNNGVRSRLEARRRMQS